MKKLTVAHVILNRFLKEYNEQMVENLHDGYGCLKEFGYRVQCDRPCYECFAKHPSNYEKGNINSNYLYGLRQICVNEGVEFKPTDEYLKIAGENEK